MSAVSTNLNTYLPGIKMKPCPSCGSTSIFATRCHENTVEFMSIGSRSPVRVPVGMSSEVKVQCGDCGMNTGNQVSQEYAIIRWNTRVYVDEENMKHEIPAIKKITEII